MTKQLGERTSLFLARKSFKGAQKRNRSSYGRQHNTQLYKKSWDRSGGKNRRLELGETIHNKGNRVHMSPKVTNRTRASVLDNGADAAGAENLAPGSRKRRRLDFCSEEQRYSPSAKPSCDTHGASISKSRRGSISRPEVEISEADYTNDWADRVQVKKIDDEHINTCDVCTLGGMLLCCAGRVCERRYHPSCLDPPFNTIPPGVWHCLECVIKKINSGVHSVSKGVEFICDVKEVKSDHKEMQNQKEYLVKYQGLAHFHNRWIPEMALPLEAAELVAKFNGRNQVKKWRKEWTIPERLIHKRLLPSEKYYKHGYSWLVKWTGLGYDHATWELEGTSLLTSREAMKLIKEYDSRHETAKGTSSFSQTNKDGKAEFSSLTELSLGDSTIIDHRSLGYVNKLRKYWHKGQNAIVIDDQVDKERVVKVIFFILSLQKVVRKPFLVVSTPHALSVWETELLHVAPRTNFIVYKGGKNTRESIRSLEFYNKIGQIMFQVLLCTADAVSEDLDVLKCIPWEAIIIDECQNSGSTRYFKTFKMLDAGMRLLVSSHIKDCSADYLAVLSLLDSGLDRLGSGKTEIQPTMIINKLKERLASYTAYDCNSSVTRFVEYWVPVRLSNVQLEQYCATLLSNSRLLCSSMQTDPVHVLREVIISTKKCCDHPYLLDRSLRSMLLKGRTNEELLDAEVQVSGKLLFLEKMLLEIRSRNLRATIIFQVIGSSSGLNSGDILEDYLSQKFGPNCYVRIDGNSSLYAHSKKQAAVKTFNADKNEKFVFLIENRACHSSIKLSLVDAVILFDSDLDPRNDIRVLQRISITTRGEELLVFRLYTCCTIEEKTLILAKEGAPIDSSISSLSPSISRLLLSWGASHLFHKLDDLHECMTSVPGSTIFPDQTFLDDVFLEFSAELPLSSEANNPTSYSFISKVEQNVEGYKSHSLLAGEKEALAINGGKPGFLLWKKLLQRKQCKWLFISDSSSNNRRKVTCANNSLNEEEIGYIEGREESQKVVDDGIDHLFLKSRLKRTRKTSTGDRDQLNSSAAHSATNDCGRVLESKTQSMLQSMKKSSLLLSKILHLSDVLKLSEDAKKFIGLFLEYLDKNYQYEWKTNSSLQAFQISVCWVAASSMKQEIDHKESLAIAKLQFNFVCEEEEANYVYSELQDVEKGFICDLKNVEPADSEVGAIMTRADEAKISGRTSCRQKDLEDGEAQVSSNCEMNSKSNTLRGNCLEEEVRLWCSGKRSKSSISVELECELEFPDSSGDQILAAQRMASEEGLAPVSTSDAITKCSNMEEGEVLPDSSGTNNSTGEAQVSSNCEMDSKSNTLRGNCLEEEVRLWCSNSGKRSKSSISVELECEGEVPDSSGDQILAAELMASEEGLAPVSTSDAITKCSNLEEGEILPDSSGTNNSTREAQVSSNCEMDSKSNTLRGNCLEEEVRLWGSNSGKRSKSSISVELECEVEFPDSSGDQILAAELMASEEGLAPVSTSDAITMCSNLEEGEILPDSSGTNNSTNTTPALQDMEEGEIPMGSECHSISEELVNLEEREIANSSCDVITLEQELGSTTLEDSFKVKMDDSSCQIELRERNIKTSKSGPNEVDLIDCTDDQQAPLDEVVFIGSAIVPTQNEPMTLQKASVSDAAQDSGTVTPVDLESHSLEGTVTHSSLVDQDVNAVQGEPCPAVQPPIATVPFTAEQRLPLEPLFFGGEGYQGGQMLSSSQETQIRRHLSLEDSTESCDPCTMHIPPQPVTSFHVGSNEQIVQDARSEINVQNFQSAANDIRFPNGHLFESPVRPEIPEHTSSDSLLVEMQRYANDCERGEKADDDMVLRLTSERDEEIRKVLQKYDPLIQGAEIARQRRKKELTEYLSKVYAHKILAQVMAMFANGHPADLAQGKEKDSVPSVVDQLTQLSAQENAQMPLSDPRMAFPVERMSSRTSACAPTIQARPCSSSMTPAPVARNFHYGNEQNEQMPALGREQYQANLPLAPPTALMSSHPSVCAPTAHTIPFSSPMMTFVPRNLHIGYESRSVAPSPAPHLQALFRQRSSGSAPNHPLLTTGHLARRNINQLHSREK